MLYQVRLRISYEYQSLVAQGRHLICVMPKNIDGFQKVESQSLEVSPAPDEQSDRTDFYGNTVTEIAFRRRHSGIRLDMNVRLERNRPDSGPKFSALLSDLPGLLSASRDVLGTAPLNFIAPSPRVVFDPAMTEFARSAVTPGTSAFDAVLGVGRALHAHLRFDPKATKVDTPASEAFANRRGVCQDFAHIMIACLRSLGVPACYVSGYLRTIPPKGKARLEGADAMHAWVRAWCGPDMGWVEYDPTNETLVGLDHIVAALGRDYSDIAPIKGIVRTSGGQKSKQSVDVVPLEW